jgi:hypothetical protein
VAAPAGCDEILRAAGEKLGVGLDGGRAVVTLEIHGRTGSVRKRTLEVKSAREDGLLRTRVELRAPPDVAGTTFLLLERAGGEDRQLMYLPALKKVRRIAGSARKGSFMGSDFSYVDLEVRRPEESTCELAGEQTVAGEATFHLVTRPKSPGPDEPYSRAELWVSKETLVPRKVELYDPAGALQKVLEVERVEERGGRRVATVSVMRNVQRKTYTRMTVDEVELGVTFPSWTFTTRGLTR